ncbi:MAG: GWxTD domain-containing protein [Acidobacteriia bacterium]|nr:GWxTD domain-containing protein [Terriglobia bacterium]
MKLYPAFPACLFLSIALLLLSTASYAQKTSESASHYKKWLGEDVVYLITPEERNVFLKLTTDEEREAFIDQFWNRRNPNPDSPENTFKEEHYRRIAYANDHFFAGIAGWRTDRGMIYIKFGPPTSIDKHPEGGSYVRQAYEGGGITSTYPFEVWYYNHIDGVGDGIELEFVDASRTNEYRLAQDADEKDALIHVPGAGMTLAESLGLQSRYDRLRVRGIGNQDSGNIHDIDPGLQPLRMQDYPMEKLQTLYNLGKSPAVKYRDLEAAVSVRVTYNQLPVSYQADILQISNDIALVPITLSFRKKDLSYKQAAAGLEQATVAVFGRVETLAGSLAYSFEDSVPVEVRDDTREKDLNQLALFQKRLPLRAGRYKLSLVVKDQNSGMMTNLQRLILVPGSSVEQLTSSSVILTPQVLPVPKGSSIQDSFVFGKYKVIPTVGNEFVAADRFVQAYFEVYNLDLDQSTLSPAVRLEISLTRDGQTVFPLTPFEREYEFVGDRLLVHKTLPFSGLRPGNYTVLFRITDLISNRTLEPRVSFILK